LARENHTRGGELARERGGSLCCPLPPGNLWPKPSREKGGKKEVIVFREATGFQSTLTKTSGKRTAHRYRNRSTAEGKRGGGHILSGEKGSSLYKVGVNKEEKREKKSSTIVVVEKPVSVKRGGGIICLRGAFSFSLM